MGFLGAQVRVWTRALLFAVIASAALQANAAPNELERRSPFGKTNTFFVQLGGFGSVVDLALDKTVGAAGYGITLGYRLRFIDFHLSARQVFWPAENLSAAPIESVFETDGGLGFLILKQQVRFSASFGTSTLLFATEFVPRGTTGICLDISPVGLRFELTERNIVEIRPLSLKISMPQLAGVPIANIAFVTTVAVEYGFWK